MENKEEVKSWDFYLSGNYRLGSIRLISKKENEKGYQVDQLVNKFIRDIDNTLSHDQRNLGYLEYDLERLLSVLYDPQNQMEKYYHMPRSAEKYVKELKDTVDINDVYLDHLYFYYLDSDKKNMSSKKNRYLVIESHPYMNIYKHDILHFAEVMRAKPYLEIEIKRKSHYFAGSTTYLRFIFDLEKCKT